MIRFVGMEILLAVFLLIMLYLVTKWSRKPLKKIIDDIKEEVNKTDED